MKIEILPDGVGSEPIVIEGTLAIIRLDDTTPILVVGKKVKYMRPDEIAVAAGDYGPDGTVRASHALDPDFNQTLRALGIDRMVVCDKLILPQPPPGARLLHGPDITNFEGGHSG